MLVASLPHALVTVTPCSLEGTTSQPRLSSYSTPLREAAPWLQLTAHDMSVGLPSPLVSSLGGVKWPAGGAGVDVTLS